MRRVKGSNGIIGVLKKVKVVEASGDKILEYVDFFGLDNLTQRVQSLFIRHEVLTLCKGFDHLGDEGLSLGKKVLVSLKKVRNGLQCSLLLHPYCPSIAGFFALFL